MTVTAPPDLWATLVRDQFISAGERLPQAVLDQLADAEMPQSVRSRIVAATEAAWQSLIEAISRG